MTLDETEQALFTLGKKLRDLGYQFVTPTPSTHGRVLSRSVHHACTLRDVFGWSRTFTEDILPPPLFELLARAGALVGSAHRYQSAVRFSTLRGHVFVHAAYPTTDADAVFFGPDTYRFCAEIVRKARRASVAVDVGCGTGAGGIFAAPTAERVVLADINEKALSYARVNAALAGARNVETVQSDVLAGVKGEIDFVVANPPYLLDDLGRTYRDGGGGLGEGLAVRIVEESARRLAPGGMLLLYTGAAIVDGHDAFFDAAAPILRDQRLTFTYEEIDPDVFGEELDTEPFAAVERIAAVVLTATR
jgi:methylase of polypeptide subunit release factors